MGRHFTGAPAKARRRPRSVGQPEEEDQAVEQRPGLAEDPEPTLVDVVNLPAAIKTGQFAIDRQAKVSVVPAHHQGVGLVGIELAPQAPVGLFFRCQDEPREEAAIRGVGVDLPVVEEPQAVVVVSLTGTSWVSDPALDGRAQRPLGGRARSDAGPASLQVGQAGDAATVAADVAAAVGKGQEAEIDLGHAGQIGGGGPAFQVDLPLCSLRMRLAGSTSTHFDVEAGELELFLDGLGDTGTIRRNTPRVLPSLPMWKKAPRRRDSPGLSSSGLDPVEVPAAAGAAMTKGGDGRDEVAHDGHDGFPSGVVELPTLPQGVDRGNPKTRFLTRFPALPGRNRGKTRRSGGRKRSTRCGQADAARGIAAGTTPGSSAPAVVAAAAAAAVLLHVVPQAGAVFLGQLLPLPWLCRR